MGILYDLIQTHKTNDYELNNNVKLLSEHDIEVTSSKLRSMAIDMASVTTMTYSEALHYVTQNLIRKCSNE